MVYRKKAHNPLSGQMEWMAVAETAADIDYLCGEEYLARVAEIGAAAAIMELPTKHEEEE
jgi:hypothetical protein